MAGAGRELLWSDYFRRLYGGGNPPDFEDIIEHILKEAGTELKLEEIYDRFFIAVGKVFENDSSRQLVREILEKLCNTGKAAHPRHGYYEAV